MARIKKEDHARILHLVDVERRAVREIAAEFGCTAANIYSLLAKLRRGSGEGSAGVGSSAEEGADETVTATLAQPGLGLEPQPVAEATETLLIHAAEPALERPVRETPTVAPPTPEKPVAAKLAIVPPDPERPAAEAAFTPERRPVLGARLSKPGMGLIMRTEDGEETMTPFRSIDDLLSAIKPILRANARSADAVWFSLQPVDLSAIDMDAA